MSIDFPLRDDLAALQRLAPPKSSSARGRGRAARAARCA